MNKQLVSERTVADAAMLELGVVLGQGHAFAVVAGRCSAAQAESIRRLREEKLYRQCCEKWDDFCPQYLKMSRTEADRLIRLLEEFGSTYFELSQLTRVSPETYRAISPAIREGKLHFNGEAIPLTAENSREVATAVAEMRRAIPKRTSTPESQRMMQELQDMAHDSKLGERIEKLHQCCLAIVKEFEQISADQGLAESRMLWNTALVSACDEFFRLAMAHGLVEN